MSRKARTAAKAIALSLLVLFSLLLLMSREAGAADLVTLDEVVMDYAKFDEGGRDPLFLKEGPKERLDININTTLLGYIVWDNKIHSMTSTKQFHVVGWQHRIGIRLSNQLELGREHFSRHLLDEAYAPQGFPVTDGWYLRWTIHLGTKPKGSLF